MLRGVRSSVVMGRLLVWEGDAHAVLILKRVARCWPSWGNAAVRALYGVCCRVFWALYLVIGYGLHGCVLVATDADG